MLDERRERLGIWLPGGRRTMTSSEAMVCFGLLTAVAFGALLAVSSSLNIVLALSVLPLVFAIVWTSPRTTILGLAVWLVALGLIRRMVGIGTSSGLGDPLLLVGPAILMLLFVVAAGRGAVRSRTPLANAVGLFSLLVLFEALNPRQGGLTIGFEGLLFLLVPMLAFWVGRALVDDRTLQRLLRLVAVLATLSAFYGLVQQFVGFPSWDTRWINSNGYAALIVGGVTRAFGSFASASEYATFLSIGLVVLVANLRVVRRTLLPLQVAAIGLVGTALVLSSVRSSIVLAVVALGAMAAARVGLRPAVALVVAALAVILLGFGFSHISFAPQSSTSSTDNPAGVLLQHEISGIAHPTGQNSTLSLHWTETVDGVKLAFSNPVGYGTGSVTRAAGRAVGASNSGTEDDLGNAGVALGLPGLVLFGVILVLGLLGTYRVAARRRDAMALAILGLIVVVLFQWLNGGLYSVAWLVWLGLGWTQRTTGQSFDSDGMSLRRPSPVTLGAGA
jgi:hypothetical protein